MLTFIRDHRLSIIKNKFILIVLFNITDIVFTLLLLKSGLFIEANPFMVKVVENETASLLLKILIPVVLVTYLYVRMQSATEKQLKTSNYFVNGLLIFYATVNVFHLLMLGLLPVLLILLK